MAVVLDKGDCQILECKSKCKSNSLAYIVESLGYACGTIPRRSDLTCHIWSDVGEKHFKQFEVSINLHIAVWASLSAVQRSTLRGCAALTYFTTIVILLISHGTLLVAVAGQIRARVV